MEPGHSSRAKKKEEMAGFVQEYAGVLEDYSANYPYQWFMFYDIWEKENKTAAN
jgi:predicted LPLAT superfamily acyltransferase